MHVLYHSSFFFLFSSNDLACLFFFFFLFFFPFICPQGHVVVPPLFVLYSGVVDEMDCNKRITMETIHLIACFGKGEATMMSFRESVANY